MPEPRPDIIGQQTAEDFSRARQKEFISRLQSFWNPGREELLSLQDVKRIVRPKGETYKGMQVVELDRIVGSEGRYHDFNKAFMPRHDATRDRWRSIDEAHYRDIILPPVRLYEIGGVYFVRDGNHRVSVARMQGAVAIDAEVTSLTSEIRIEPDMTRDELMRAVIRYEKELFYEETYFGIITECQDLDFSSPGQYDVIYNHIEVHKYYINQGSAEEIPFGRALRSWYDNVYEPIADLIRSERLLDLFPGRTVSDLYVYIVRHWDALKAAEGQATLEGAVRDFALKHGRTSLDRVRGAFRAFWAWLIKAARRLFRG